MVNYIGFCESFKKQYEINRQEFEGGLNLYFCTIFLYYFCTIFSIMAIFWNILIIDALRRCCSLHSPSKVLLFSLAFSDLCVGCIAQPLFVIHRLAALKSNYLLYCIAGIGFTFSGSTVVVASLLTTTAIAVDCYLSLHLRFRYREVVTLNHVVSLVIALVPEQRSSRYFKDCPVLCLLVDNNIRPTSWSTNTYEEGCFVFLST